MMNETEKIYRRKKRSEGKHEWREGKKRRKENGNSERREGKRKERKKGIKGEEEWDRKEDNLKVQRMKGKPENAW